MIGDIFKIWQPIYKYLNKVKRPVFTIIFMVGILCCYLYFKFDENRRTNQASKVMIIEKQATIIHQQDVILERIDAIEDFEKGLPEQIKQAVSDGNRMLVAKLTRQLEHIITYMDSDKKRLIDELYNWADAYNDNITKRDTINLSIKVKKHESNK